MSKTVLVLFDNKHSNDAEHTEEVFQNELTFWSVPIEQKKIKKEIYYVAGDTKLLFKNMEQTENTFNGKHLFDKIYVTSSLKKKHGEMMKEFCQDIVFCEQPSQILIDMVMEFETYFKNETVNGFYYDEMSESVKSEKVKERQIGKGKYFSTEEELLKSRNPHVSDVLPTVIAEKESDELPFYVSVESEKETVLVEL